ncbi:hypothetical protein ACTOB_003561 [Actinoplanes oblitus]|uniref:Uncharacterized protein n=1 Tax=Actinoplanes oblitus TaxID=3040509 RepID=A0ABY8WQG3_9ACTN|nr:hypothetical protein [Actinoplanes oblitus]WIM99893.1 hypothetical protein ACTOB_003561 [Actinoplanes oblitus]
MAGNKGEPRVSAEQVGREILSLLGAVEEAGPEKWDLLLGAVNRLTDLHDVAEGGELPEAVDGRNFKQTLAREWDRLRPQVRDTVEARLDEFDLTADHNMYQSLQARSAVQFLKDDFAGTVADGLVDDEWLASADDELRERVRYFWPEYEPPVPPSNLPLSHWWWDVMFQAAMPDHVWLFQYGEPGKVTPACYVANWAYPRPELAEAALAQARAYFAGLPVHVEVSQARNFDTFAAGWVPAWADFRKRFVLKAVPLPARFGPQDYGFPSGWDLMMAEIQRSCAACADELRDLAAHVSPQANAVVQHQAPLRLPRLALSGPAQQWGFETSLFLGRSHRGPGIGPTRARVAALVERLTVSGWLVGPVRMDPELSVSGRTVTATRDLHTLVAFAEPNAMHVHIDSPGYRADGPGWIVEENRHRRQLSSPWQERSSIFPRSAFPEKGDEGTELPPAERSAPADPR